MKRLFFIGGVALFSCLTIWVGLRWSLVENALRLSDGVGNARRFEGRFPEGARCIHVLKSRGTLILTIDGREVFRAKAALGGAPIGHKTRQGDLKTPEGVYYVCTRNERSRFHLFLGISYPGIDDADTAHAHGIISAKQRKEIDQAIRKGECPPWNTALGGAVGIHGSGNSRDWTLGCIALNDEDIELLWAHCPLGTPIIVYP
jgi:murein L,D-transpeptidase YafK